MSTLLIYNVRIVNEGLIREADVFIKNGRIEQIGTDLSHNIASHTIDGSGKHLIPGAIDPQFSLAASNDFLPSLQSETKAAIAGGITSSLLLPSISDDLPELLKAYEAGSCQSSLQSNLSMYFPIIHSNLEALSSIDPSRYCGVYVDMASSNDDYRIDDQATLTQIFDESPILVVLHAEHAPSILESEESYRQIYGDDIPFHLHGLIRSAGECYTAAFDALSLALETDANIHLLNVSSANEIELISRCRQKKSFVSTSVSSHYLTFSDADYADKGALIKCDPSIKTDIDRAALMQGLLDDNIDLISSDHRVLNLEDKQGSYFDVPSGVPLAQYFLPSILEHYQDQILSLEVIVQKTSHAVADRFGIVDRGYIREGYWADLVLIDLEGSFIARDEDVISEAGWTVFNGNEFRSSVVTTIVNGTVVWSDGAFVDHAPAGKLLTFTGSS